MKSILIIAIFSLNYIVWKYLLYKLYVKISHLNSISKNILLFLVFLLIPYEILLVLFHSFWGNYEIITKPILVMTLVYVAYIFNEELQKNLKSSDDFL